MIRLFVQFCALTFFVTNSVYASKDKTEHRLVQPAQAEQARPTWEAAYLIPWQKPGELPVSPLPPCSHFGCMENVDFLHSPICGDFELGIFDNTSLIATPVFQNITFMMNGSFPEIKGDKRANVSLRIDFFDEYHNNLHAQIIRYWYGNILINKGEKAPEVEIESPRDDGSMRMADLIVPTNGSSFMHLAHLQLVRDWIAKLEGMSDTEQKEDRLNPTILLPLMNPVLRAVKCLITLTSQEAQEGDKEPVVRKKKWVTGARNEPFKGILYRLMNYLFEEVRRDKEEIVTQRRRAEARGTSKTFAQEVEEITNHFYKDKKKGETLTTEEKEEMTYEIIRASEREKKQKAEEEKIKAENERKQREKQAEREGLEVF